MKRWKKILFCSLGAVLLVAIGIFVMAFQNMRPTTGKHIDKYPTPHAALLIIDIQEDYTGPQAKKPFRDGNRIVVASNALIAQAQTRGVIVVYIENVISNPIMSILTGGITAPGSPGTEMDQHLTKVPGAKTFTKSRSDAFSNPALDEYLRKNQVDHLLLVGLDAAYCVNATTRGALNRGYRVTLFLEGIATESKKSMDSLSQDWLKAGAQVKTGAEL